MSIDANFRRLVKKANAETDTSAARLSSGTKSSAAKTQPETSEVRAIGDRTLPSARVSKNHPATRREAGTTSRSHGAARRSRLARRIPPSMTTRIASRVQSELASVNPQSVADSPEVHR